MLSIDAKRVKSKVMMRYEALTAMDFNPGQTVVVQHDDGFLD